MANLGDIASVGSHASMQFCHNYQTKYRPFGGNGPITNTGLTAAPPNGLIVLSHSSGARTDATRADGTGIWAFYDLQVGRYTAVDVNTNGQWFIDVAADGTFTVTENPGAPVTTAYAFA